MPQFLLFCIGGVIGFVVDAGILRLLVSGLAMNAYAARLISFLCAATATWLWNRHNTFRGTRRYGLLGEWARYLLAMSGGFVVNYGTYALLYAFVPLVQRYPELGVAAGSAAGLVVNYASSRWWIYRREEKA
ncbi:GtrA family protein [Tahibacter caeni]|uniref:GtrA family protein n=1 Tax=Tahibacter caeni TaxID=1453545 RepID=UPI002147E507|nr:GtrA family protein [Tahibacter caeni]